jgi:hypothetical protein
MRRFVIKVNGSWDLDVYLEKYLKFTGFIDLGENTIRYIAHGKRDNLKQNKPTDLYLRIYGARVGTITGHKLIELNNLLDLN